MTRNCLACANSDTRCLFWRGSLFHQGGVAFFEFWPKEPQLPSLLTRNSRSCPSPRRAEHFRSIFFWSNLNLQHNIGGRFLDPSNPAESSFFQHLGQSLFSSLSPESKPDFLCQRCGDAYKCWETVKNTPQWIHVFC